MTNNDILLIAHDRSQLFKIKVEYCTTGKSSQLKCKRKEHALTKSSISNDKAKNNNNYNKNKPKHLQGLYGDDANGENKSLKRNRPALLLRYNRIHNHRKMR